MPTKPLTRKQIEARAAEDAAVLAQFHREDMEREQVAAQRQAEAQHEWDQQFVAGFSRAALEADIARTRAALEADIARTRAALDEVIAAHPLTVALVEHLVALRRRSHTLLELNAALARLGRPTSPPNVTTELQHLDEYVLPVAARIATEQVAAEMAQLHARRQTAGTDNNTDTEENQR